MARKITVIHNINLAIMGNTCCSPQKNNIANSNHTIEPRKEPSTQETPSIHYENSTNLNFEIIEPSVQSSRYAHT